MKKSPSPFERRIVFFVWAPGCESCEAAEPELVKFERKNHDVLVMRLNAEARRPHELVENAKGTPTYFLQVEGDLKKKHLGVLRAAELERWAKTG